MKYQFNRFVNANLQASHETEVPQLLTVWGCVSGAAAMLGRKVHLPFGSSKIFPNLYTLFIGSAGARKSTAINLVRKYLQEAGYESFAAEKVTMQKFLMDLAGLDLDTHDADGRPKDFLLDQMTIDGLNLRAAYNEQCESAAYLLHGEFSDFIGQNNYPFINLLGELWDKDGIYKYRVKNNQSFEIYNIVVNILGGATPGGFNLMFPAEIADQGMLSRLIVVCTTPRDKKVPWPVASCPELTTEIVSGYHAMSRMRGVADFEPDAKTLVENIYRSWLGFDDPRFEGYATRRHTQLLKIAMIFAAMRGSLLITASDVTQAHTLLSYTERLMPVALGGYGKGKYSDVAHKILLTLRSASKPLPMQDLFRLFIKDVDRPEHLMTILSGLRQAEQVQVVNGGYLPVLETVRLKAADEYADWQLLKGIAADTEILSQP